jgi:transposase-like protein
MIAGVSTRNYRVAIQAVEDGYGIGRTTISEAMKEATARELEEFCERTLEEFKACTLIIDAVKVARTSIVLAIGIAENGEKKGLGMRLGATENAQMCIELLEDLKRRGLDMGHLVLIVKDIRIPMPTDHGHLMSPDHHRQGIYPGYSLFGRMRNLAELRGIELGIRRSMDLE